MEKSKEKLRAPTQEEVGRMVRQEVLCCVSGLVSTLANAAAFAGGKSKEMKALSALCDAASLLSGPVLDYEEAAIQAGWKWDDGGPHFHRAAKGGNAFTPHDYQHIKDGDWEALCEAEGIEPYEREVYEHWAVSQWLGEKLIEQGEKVDTDFEGLNVWARCTTGQAISADGVIVRICQAAQYGMGV